MFDFGKRVAVKICGVTDRSDAIACANAGADFIGLNLSPLSRRCIEPYQAVEIAAAVRANFPKVRFVGIFVDQDLEHVRQLTAALALDAVQLHGEESTEYVEKLSAPFVIKALKIRARASRPIAAGYNCDAILLDAWSAVSPGGTGETFSWSFAAELRPQVARLILAGGLTCENVARAIQLVRPFAVDVCSGVESAPGRKDEARVRAFIAAARTRNEEN